MTGLRQAWLVALREVRERSRSRSFRAGLILMLVVVIALIVVPAKLDTGGGTKDVGLTSAVPGALSSAILAQGAATGTTVRVHRYDDVAAGEEAVRADDVDVLLADAHRLEWPGRVDEQLRAVVAGAIQLVAVQERAAAAGIDPNDLRAVMAPVPVANVELGSAAGRSTDDELAAIVMTALLLVAIVIYGNLVLTGVVEEKSSRVVEVLLARIPARALLAGKVAGIGLLGFAQFALTAVAALIATLVVDSVDIPAVGAGVLAWTVVWFMLGYALYAMAYGALGALASRTEDAQSVAGPIGYVLIACYWAAFLTVSGDPDGVWSRLLSLFPATAPFAMPGRIALGSVTWWEPLLAVALTLAAITCLVALAGRVYTNAILHSGSTLRLRDAWHSDQAPQPPMAGAPARTTESRPSAAAK
jgi:ABC-2 type transport system permease protein